jgi:hypothetical protein
MGFKDKFKSPGKPTAGAQQPSQVKAQTLITVYDERGRELQITPEEP